MTVSPLTVPKPEIKPDVVLFLPVSATCATPKAQWVGKSLICKEARCHLKPQLSGTFTKEACQTDNQEITSIENR